jgi:diketogulonate reductase-like aldo/keto reductase
MSTRREFLTAVSALPLAALATPALAQRSQPSQPTMPLRRFAGNERLPVIGLGSSKAVEEIASRGEDPVRQVLRTLVAHGGRVVDTWPRNPANDQRFGQVINEPGLRERLFVTGKIDRMGKDAGVAQFREIQRSYGRKTIDLMQIFSLTDVDAHWPSLRRWKESGEAKYIGVTVSELRLHGALEEFVKREKPDVFQVNYSITERQAENRILPMAADLGVPVIINRPFMNGAYFRRLEKTPLPAWTAEFDCKSWSDFSLKYILAHPAVTVVLTETTNPSHMEENARAAFGAVPDAAARQRMRQLIDAMA